MSNEFLLKTAEFISELSEYTDECLIGTMGKYTVSIFRDDKIPRFYLGCEGETEFDWVVCRFNLVNYDFMIMGDFQEFDQLNEFLSSTPDSELLQHINNWQLIIIMWNLNNPHNKISTSLPIINYGV